MLGLSHIELLAERTPDPDNPVWSADGRRQLVAAADAAGIAIPSLCIDEPLETPFDDTEPALDLATRLAPVTLDLHLEIVVLPLLEASDLHVLDRPRAAWSVCLLADRLRGHGTRLALELGISAVESLRFLEAVGSPSVGLCYDLGNATALGFDVAAELRLLGPHVWHIHVKDKDARGENVRYGTGQVQFAPALAELRAHGFDGLLTMEATRGEDPVVTAAEHQAFLLAMDASGLPS